LTGVNRGVLGLRISLRHQIRHQAVRCELARNFTLLG